jgi:hypothetical protein
MTPMSRLVRKSWLWAAAGLLVTSAAIPGLLASALVIPSWLRSPLTDFVQPGITVWWLVLGGPFQTGPSSPGGIAFAAIANAGLWLLVVVPIVAIVGAVRRVFARRHRERPVA